MPPTTTKRLARLNERERVPHVPVRQCVGCRTRAEKRTMLRFTREDGGAWVADPAARRSGRGAYVCSPQCIERLKKNTKYRGLLSAQIAPADWPARAQQARDYIGDNG